MEKKYIVKVTPRAEADLDNVHSFLWRATLDMEIAAKVCVKIENAIAGLASRPHIRPMLPRDGIYNECFRKEICGDYIIPFLIHEPTQTIYVTHIFNGRANYQQYL